MTSERSDGGFGHGDLEMVQEHDERETETSSENQSEDADDEREMTKAASVIQGKFRERMQRRSMADITNNGNDSGKNYWNYRIRKCILNFDFLFNVFL